MADPQAMNREQATPASKKETLLRTVTQCSAGRRCAFRPETGIYR
jgi:hypothetical protein